MNFVQPIRDPERIQQLKEYFKENVLCKLAMNRIYNFIVVF